MHDDLPPNVTAYPDRHGRIRYRFRRKGLPSRELPGLPGSSEFAAAYAEASAGVRRPSSPQGMPTLRDAWVEIQRTHEWRSLRPSSAYQQTGVAERFLSSPIATGASRLYGGTPVAEITRADVKRIIGTYAATPHAGHAVLKFLRKACLVALDLGWIDHDPTYRVEYRPALRGHRGWTDAELQRFEDWWEVGTRERLAFALALYTGQRRADLAAMRWSAFDGTGIAVVQEKTRAPLWIPAHPDLRAILAETHRHGPAMIATEYGTPYTTESFGNLMADAIADAELPNDCRLHGLRKTAGRCLADAGCTAHQIMAILGHRTLAEAERYTRDAEQRRLAQAAIDRWTRPVRLMPSGKARRE